MITAVLEHPTVTLAPTWTDADLAAQFRLCEQWQDADQWEALGFLYLQRFGPMCLNVNYCFRKCDELRMTSAASGGSA
jgi:hypothetical protein